MKNISSERSLPIGTSQQRFNAPTVCATRRHQHHAETMTTAAFLTYAPLSLPCLRATTTPPRRSPSPTTKWCMAALPPTSQPSRTPSKSSPPLAVVAKLSDLNHRVQSIKCPFWRRRFSDSLEAAVQVVTWITRTRHKSLPLPSPLLLSALKRATSKRPKSRHLDLQTRLHIIRDDFLNRQYYVTGRLTSPIYCDDCLFDSPDPDGRVRGLRKFCDAAAGLFDARISRIDLIDIYTSDGSHVVAEWRLEGALMLPWRPIIKPFLGTTTYSFDGDGLVCSHVETWDISVVDAFVSVVVKGFGAAPAPPASVIREEREERKHQKDVHDLGLHSSQLTIGTID